MTRPQPPRPSARAKPLVHLRKQTENMLGGERLIAWCGASRLASRKAEREVTKNGRVVTCPVCYRVMHPERRVRRQEGVK